MSQEIRPLCHLHRCKCSPYGQDVDLLLLDVRVVVFDLCQHDLLELVEALDLGEDHLALVVRQKPTEEQVPKVKLSDLAKKTCFSILC